jgi:hypothetical protein
LINLLPGRTACCTSARSPTSASKVTDYLKEGQIVKVRSWNRRKKRSRQVVDEGLLDLSASYDQDRG